METLRNDSPPAPIEAEMSFDDVLAMVEGEISNERDVVLQQLQDAYGDRTFRYKSYTGTVTHLFNVCPAFPDVIARGFDYASDWLEANDQPEEVSDDETEEVDEPAEADEDAPDSGEPDVTIVKAAAEVPTKVVEAKPVAQPKPAEVAPTHQPVRQPDAAQTTGANDQAGRGRDAMNEPARRAIAPIAKESKVAAAEVTPEAAPAPESGDIRSVIDHDDLPMAAETELKTATQQSDASPTVDVYQEPAATTEEPATPAAIPESEPVVERMSEAAYLSDESAPAIEEPRVAVVGPAPATELESDTLADAYEERPHESDEAPAPDELAPEEVEAFEPDTELTGSIDETEQDEPLAVDDELPEATYDEPAAEFRSEAIAEEDELTADDNPAVLAVHKILEGHDSDAVVDAAETSADEATLVNTTEAVDDVEDVANAAGTIEDIEAPLQTIVELTVGITGELPDSPPETTQAEVAERISNTVVLIQKLESAHTAEECHEALTEIRLELASLLKLLGYDNAEAIAERLVKQYDMASLRQYLAQLVRLLESRRSESTMARQFKPQASYRQYGIHAVGMLVTLNGRLPQLAAA